MKCWSIESDRVALRTSPGPLPPNNATVELERDCQLYFTRSELTYGVCGVIV